jgi:hypothetical protein
VPVGGPGDGHGAARPAVLALGLALAVLAAACGSSTGAGDGSGGGSPTAGRPLAPFVGTLTTVALPAGVQSLQDVDCPSATRCWAVGTTLGTGATPAAGAVVTTTSGGSRWSVQPVPPTVGHLAAVACPTTRSCAAVGQVGTDGAGPGAVLTTTDAGATWVLRTVPAGTTDVTAVSCPAPGTCTALAVVSGRVTTLTGGPGSTWSAGGALPATVGTATGLSCTTARRCWATVLSPVDAGHAAGGVAATTDGGATWVLQTVPPGTGALEGIDCTPSTGTTTATSTTTSSTRPATGTAAGSAPTVALPVDCTAVGTTSTTVGVSRVGQAVVLTTATGGATWIPAPVTATGAALVGVSCGAGPCVAVGTTVAVAPAPGLAVLASSAGTGAAGWRRGAVAAAPLPLTGVSCRALSACVMVGESVSAHLTGS